MPSNLDRYRKDLDDLILKGGRLLLSMQLACFPEQIESAFERQFGTKAAKMLKELPSVKQDYQTWYSEAKALVKQLLPDRLLDFVRHYEQPKSRKEITFANYGIEDYLQGITVTRGYAKEKIVGPDAAVPHLEQQIAILTSISARFKSSLFDIQQLVQADLFDSELDSARELAKHKFFRASGAMAGVVLEKHLAQVCENHNIKVLKKDPSISDLNDLLKKESVIETAQWRSIQFLSDIRNLCDHNKAKEPTKNQIDDLIDGVAKLIKTLF